MNCVSRCPGCRDINTGLVDGAKMSLAFHHHTSVAMDHGCMQPGACACGGIHPIPSLGTRSLRNNAYHHQYLPTLLRYSDAVRKLVHDHEMAILRGKRARAGFFRFVSGHQLKLNDVASAQKKQPRSARKSASEGSEDPCQPPGQERELGNCNLRRPLSEAWRLQLDDIGEVVSGFLVFLMFVEYFRWNDGYSSGGAPGLVLSLDCYLAKHSDQ
ncbi:hypothetical protein BDP55DRAFT_327530 [Colletotrichum godetiae]|uniref:Uncharacterized protein n=1 Tax=Colletotrichum godetiae TaxID=1209918 RepID=A0AAJ0ABD8_9PEZI|nr:uncharacterized protein BDP55DRAFT_327530 [Colletotrichum godetiae]KAK1660027.1 hypothetical protein BDP55DRAFT_327530 [Colletotrichum godetiae]